MRPPQRARWSAPALFELQGQRDPLTLQPLVYEPLEQGIALKNESKLGPALQAAMKQIMTNGTYPKILSK
jgi:polar amino acid transport system substrate-binding protein